MWTWIVNKWNSFLEGSFQKQANKMFEQDLSKNVLDQTIMHRLPVMEKEADPEDLTLENAYRTRWIWYHTILAVLIFFTNLLLFGIFVLLAIKL
jgi:hypothetical protein